MASSWVYILQCSDGSYYTGCTTNLEQRIHQHNFGFFDGYTATRKPVQLLWSQEFPEIHFAIEAERRIKKWTRAKKVALMKGDWELLKQLSKSTATKRKQ